MKAGQQHILACAAVPVMEGVQILFESKAERRGSYRKKACNGCAGKERSAAVFRPFVTHGEKHISIISVDILFGDMPIMCDESFTILCRKREV